MDAYKACLKFISWCWVWIYTELQEIRVTVIKFVKLNGYIAGKQNCWWGSLCNKYSCFVFENNAELVHVSIKKGVLLMVNSCEKQRMYKCWPSSKCLVHCHWRCCRNFKRPSHLGCSSPTKVMCAQGRATYYSYTLKSKDTCGHMRLKIESRDALI